MAYRDHVSLHIAEFEARGNRNRSVSELLANILKGLDLAKKNPQITLLGKKVHSNPSVHSIRTYSSNNDKSENTTADDSSEAVDGSYESIECGARLSTKPRSYSMDYHNKVVPISPKSVSLPSTPSNQYWSRDHSVKEQIIVDRRNSDTVHDYVYIMEGTSKRRIEDPVNKKKKILSTPRIGKGIIADSDSHSIPIIHYENPTTVQCSYVATIFVCHKWKEESSATSDRKNLIELGLLPHNVKNIPDTKFPVNRKMTLLQSSSLLRTSYPLA